uniref:Large ribosomal subunit protein eL14 domain-containing protein n=1 Tax=Prasinoderma singulare TaxID=676789 RepID=A0A7S3BSD8_9VIRI|mmetsp:Transcript_22293/g.68942  ORF Transcript_22293/g.68942 Transcript_22293/m.68942 type:complete len:128 (+) Transcript_22293:55-438(+)
MPFRRYVELGRVAMVNYGPDYGKLVVIVDFIDQNRALVDAPGMVRCQYNFKRLGLTDQVISVGKTPSKEELKAAWDSADVAGTFAASSWGKKLAKRKAKVESTDFSRYKDMVARVKRNRKVRAAMKA